jgi:hypothetical protein
MVRVVEEVLFSELDELPPAQEDAGAAPHAQVVVVSLMSFDVINFLNDFK